MKKVILNIVFLFVAMTAWSQRPIEIIPQVMLPFPYEFDELLEDYTNYTFTVINYSFTDQDVYFLADLIGDNGVSVTTNRDYRPSEPFSIGAGQTLVLTGTDLQEMNAGVSTNDLDIEGLSPIQLAQGVIPEGTYQLCINAFDFETAEQLSVGCSFGFPVGNGDVPAIITPFEEEIIPETEIPSFPITWETPSSNPMSAMDYEYVVKIIDLSAYADLDLEEVFQDGGVAVQLETEIMGTSYFYNAEGDDPELIFGHQYAIRVQVIDMMNEVEFENGGYSEIRTFWYGEIPDNYTNENETDQQEELPVDCYTRCNITTPTNATAITDISSIPSLKVGHFYIEEYDLSNSGNGFSGEGEITLNFLNDLKVRVMVSNAQINSAGEMISGSVRGMQEDMNEISEFMDYVGFGENLVQGAEMADDFIPADAAAQIGNYLHDARLIAALAGAGNTSLPIAFTESIQGNEFTLGITDLILTPTSAKAKLVSGTKLAMFEGDNWLMFVADSLCIHPSGFGGEYNLSLGADLVLQNENENAFEIFMKGGTSGSENICQLIMNCDGLQAVDFAGELHFPRNVIVPVTEEDSIMEEKAKAYFSFSLNNANNNGGSAPSNGEQSTTEQTDEEPTAPGQLTGMHWVAELTMDRFQVPKLKGWTFDISTAFWDMSEIENPDDVIFPPNYPNTDIDFTGVWIQNATISPPLKMCASPEERTSLEINNLFIDPALYCQIDVNNVLQLGRGKVGGWAFGIDLFQLDIWNNELLEASLNGELHMPLLDTSSSILYTGTIGQGESESTDPGVSPGDGDYAYNFNMSFSENVEYSFMIAEGHIDDDSYFEMNYNPSESEETFVHVILHGELTVSTELFYPESLPELPADINLPSMEYSFDYHSIDGINEDQTFIAFASPQKLLAGFPINLDNFDVGISMTDADEVAVDFGVQISLSQDQTDLAAGAYFSLISNLTTMSMFESVTSVSDAEGAWDAVQSIKLDRVQFDSITLDIEMSKLSINGKIAFYNNPIPGTDGGRDKGVRGDVSVVLPIDGITGRLTAIFGNTGVPAATYSENYFAYWYVEGLITFPVGIPLGSTGIGLYGLGGGIGKNMIQTSSPEVVDGQVFGESVFAPVWQSFRLKFTAVFGTIPEPDAFNADISFIAQFVDGGLDMIGIEGNGYIMASISERANAAVTVGMGIYMYLGNANRDFAIDGYLNVGVNVADGLLVGNMDAATIPNQMVSATFHASPETFFFYMGEPDFDLYDDFDPRGSARLDLAGILQADLKAYMMVGHGIPTALPPLPIPVQNILNNPEGSLGGTASASSAQGQTGGIDYESGAGFAHGVYVNVRSDIDALLLYATLDVHLGYDMNITQRTTQCANTGDRIGINGWYAEGQAYAGVTGGMGLQLKLFGKQRQFELFQLAAAIALTGGGPNPFYFTGRASVAYSLLGGKIRGSSSFSMMVGERCTPALDDPFAGINFFELIEPDHGENDVFVGTALHAKFALPMSDVIVIPVPVEDEEGVITSSINTRYRPEVTYSMQKVQGNEIVNLQQPMWSDDQSHEEFYMLPQNGLSPNRNYDFTMTVKAWDYQENEWLRVDGSLWSQDTTVRFRTGQLPPDLYNYVTLTVPLPMERFFLQNESGDGKIYFSQNIDEDFYFPETASGTTTMMGLEFDYYVRFTNLETQDEVEVPFTYFANTWSQKFGLDFNIPTLDNGAVYALQVIRRSPFTVITTSLTSGATQEVEIANVSDQDASTEIDLINAVPAPPAEQLNPGEFLLYHTYFRTSEFNRMREKVAAATTSSVEYGTANPAHYGKKLEINLNLAEKFETRDLNKFQAASGAYAWMEFEPRIRILDIFAKPYHNNYAEPLVEDFRNYYVDDVWSSMFYFQWPDDEMLIDWSQSPLYRIPKSNIQTSLRPPLNMNEVSALWESYIGASPYVMNVDLISSTSFTSYDIYTGQPTTFNGPSCKIIYDTHYKVSKDRKEILDWSANYLSHWTPMLAFSTYESMFQVYAPQFITMRNQLSTQSLKLNNHSGAYALQFARNISTEPNEEMFNIFTMHHMNFSTPSAQLQMSVNSPTISATTTSGSATTSGVISGTVPTTIIGTVPGTTIGTTNTQLNTNNIINQFSGGFYNFSNN